jgi:hypothetical protein
MDIKMRKIIILASVVIILIFGVGFVFKRIQKQTTGNLLPTPTIINTNLKTFSSTTMKLIFKFPEQFRVDENMGLVTIVSTDGKITLSRVSTDYNSLNDFLKDLDSKNKPKILEDRDIQNNQYIEKLRYIEIRGKEEKIYWVFTDGWVYSISTIDSSLYPDLDQIAQSFRYTP